MKKIATGLLLLATAAFCFGQAPGPAVSPLGSGSDVYVGFLATSPDYGAAGSGGSQFGVESGFAYRLGAGADLQLTRRIYWRIIQYDVQPQPWGPPTPWYQNFGGGVGFRF